MKQNTKPIDKQKQIIQKIDVNIEVAKNTVQISSIPIFSPFQLYEGQRMFIQYIIQCLQKKQNALVQSPTGTGKTLSLLCSTLSWVRYQQQLGKQPPRIIYTSRTHAQLKQVVQQLNKTGFTLKLSILGSRDQTCINQDLKQLSGQGKQLECRLRVMRKNNLYCKYFHHQDFYSKLNQIGKIADLQEIKNNGKTQGFCPFFYQKHCKNIANLILMPYTYLIDEKSSKGQDLSSIVQNSILIFDEAHNIPNACQNSKQFTISLTILSRALQHLNDLRQHKLSEQKKVVSKKNTQIQQPVKLMKSSLKQLQMHASYISKIHSHMQTLQISLQEGLVTNAYDFLLCLDNGTQSSQFGKLSTKIQNLIESSTSITNDILLKPYWALQAWFSFLQRIAQVQVISKKQQKMTYFKTQICYNGSDIKINLFCLDPKIGFQRIIKMKPLSIILTSGTLSPLNSIPLQLQVEFNRPLACPHIMSKQQVNGCILTMGPNKIKLNFSYENRDKTQLYKQVGDVIVQIVNKTPNGVIIFVPSYSVLEKIKIKFTDLGIMAKLYAKKNIFFQKSNSVDFKQILESYLNQSSKQKGAILFALARGKISQGLDFSDQKCRAVVMIGVPYPAAKDLKVTSKMQYLDEKSKSIKTINGNQWYICQTIRCINQSIGRIIRNKHDYGSIYLLDQRFKKNQILSQISGWARQCLKIIDDFQEFKFKIDLFQQYFQKKNRQLEQVQHFFISHMGTKLTNKIQPKIKNTRNTNSNFFNQLKHTVVQPQKQLMALKADLKQKEQEALKKKQQQKQPTKQKIIFGMKGKKMPVVEIKQCPICRQQRKLIKNTQCIHEICEQCWDIWLKKDLRCPICRVRVRQKYLIK